MTTHHIALIHKEQDSGYGVSFPDVPGVTAVADTLDEALHEAGIALCSAFEDWQGARPSPRSLGELRKDRNFVDWSANASSRPPKGWRTRLDFTQ